MTYENLQTETSKFEDKFNSRETIKLYGGITEIVDINPENPKKDVPVLLAPGWAGSLDLYKNAIEKLSDDRRVLSLEHPRHGHNGPIPIEIDTNEYSQEQLRKALNLIGLLDYKNIKSTDAIAHSEGAINLVIAATLYPDKFRNIVLFAPAGLSGKETFTRLFTDFTNFAINQGKEADIDKSVLKTVLDYVARNPLRAMNEALGISQDQIHELLRYLHKEKNIGITIIATENDNVFDLSKIQETVKTDMLDGFLVVKGDHADTIKGKAQYMENSISIASEMLEKMESKNLQKQSSQP
jgi:pimeloyl-ACP methyl ester carboxylesterase